TRHPPAAPDTGWATCRTSQCTGGFKYALGVAWSTKFPIGPSRPGKLTVWTLSAATASARHRRSHSESTPSRSPMIETASWPPKCATDSSGRRAQDSRPALPPALHRSRMKPSNPDQHVHGAYVILGRERGLRSLGDSIGKPSAIFRAHRRILRRTFVNNMHVWCRFVAVCCQVTHPHCAMVRWFCRWRIIFGSAQIAGQFARQLGDMTNVGARTPAGCCTGAELRTPGAAPQTRMVSVARIRLGSWESARAFKGIICDDVSEFESYMPSQPVRSPPACHRVFKRVRYFVQVYQDIVITDDWGLEDALGILQFVLVLLVASIPVAMPAVFSITMALGALALSRQRAIVSKLSAIEEMAGVDIL